MNSNRKPEYYLLNKDEIIASFYVNDILQTATLVEQFKEIPELFNLKELLYRKRIKHYQQQQHRFIFHNTVMKTVCDILCLKTSVLKS